MVFFTSPRQTPTWEHAARNPLARTCAAVPFGTDNVKHKKIVVNWGYYHAKLGTPTASGCVPWIGCKDGNGYGMLRTKNDGKWGTTPSHRLSWILHRGPIPDGLFVCHHCDNPPCVNPDHLFLGTAKDNRDDCVRKGRADFGVVRGISHHSAKLTPSKVRKIRLLYDRGVSGTKIAEIYGVSNQSVYSILSGAHWKHV